MYTCSMDHPYPPLPQLAGRVLFVDDEEIVLRLGQRLLAEIGCQVTTCHDPREALEVFRQDPAAFDLVLTDHLMPGMTGRELAKKLLATRPDLPILLISGAGEDLLESPPTTPGIRECLAKPIILAELAAALGRYLPNL